jgi:shikimate dehydrogenase
MTGLDVSYDRLIPKDLGLSFEETFARAQVTGFRGINVTYPYKELAAKMVTIPDRTVAAIRAVNTVVFEDDGPKGYNTDYSGFKRAYRGVMGQASAGTVCLIGTGGVGKAVAFGLIDLGADVLRLVDLDKTKADTLADALRPLAGRTRIEPGTDAVALARGADGIVNCTPLGMVGIGGTPLPAPALAGAKWCFDAVYTPVKTTFLRDAGDTGLKIISGYELFFGQGIDAWQIFTGQPLDHDALRQAISDEPG